MAVRWLESGETVGAARGEIVVCIPVYGGHEHFVACLDSVLAHTPPEVRILICDDASPDRRSLEHVAELGRAVELERVAGSERELLYTRRERNAGFPANANGAFASAAPADVVLLNSDCVVAQGWLEGLRDAAYVDPSVATATALTNHGTIVSVPGPLPTPRLPEGRSLTEAAAAVRSRSLRIRPRLLTAVGHCVYVRRSALELVGEFDLAFSPGYGEEVDFSQRCLGHGLLHVAADEVLVLHHGGASFSTRGLPSPIQAEHEQLLADRYPYYHDAVRAAEEDLTGPLSRALGAARRALTGLSVVIDPGTGRLGAEVSELVAALGKLDGLRVALASTSSAQGRGRADVVHRLAPFSDRDELAATAALGDRLVLTHHDLLDWHDPLRFDSFAAWEERRSLTRDSLSAADLVVFPTEEARRGALAEELVASDRTGVLGELAPSATGSTWTAGAERLAELYQAACDGPSVRGRAVPESSARRDGNGGALPPELERPLLALAAHPPLARPVFAAIKAGYELSHRLRRRRRDASL